MNDRSSLPPVAPDDPTEKLNTKAAGIIGIAVMCSRLLGLNFSGADNSPKTAQHDRTLSLAAGI